LVSLLYKVIASVRDLVNVFRKRTTAIIDYSYFSEMLGLIGAYPKLNLS